MSSKKDLAQREQDNLEKLMNCYDNGLIDIRSIVVVTLRAAGMTYEQIGQMIGHSRQFVFQLYKEARAKIERNQL